MVAERPTYVDLGDLTVAVEEYGSGIPVILLHGFPLSSEIWSPVMPALGTVARVVAPDLPGFGRSGLPSGGFSMNALAATIVRLTDALGLERFVLGGHSMGGYVAMRVAAACPQRLLGLLLFDTRPGPDDATARERRNAAIESIRLGRRNAFLDSFVPNLVGASTRERAPRLIDELRGLADGVGAEVLVAALEGMRDRPDSSGVLHSLGLAAQVVVGEEDTLTPPEVARQMAEMMPNATLAVIPGAGHTPSVERPIAVAEAITAFLRREIVGA